jgi:hypothetical protein
MIPAMSGTDEPISVDLAALREQFPGWTFGTVWASAATGPDARRLWAMRDGFLLSAWTAAELAAEIRRQVIP